MNRKIKHNTHPGELFREEIINAYGLTITEVAEMLGVTRPAISNLVNEKTGNTDPSFCNELPLTPLYSREAKAKIDSLVFLSVLP